MTLENLGSYGKLFIIFEEIKEKKQIVWLLYIIFFIALTETHLCIQ